MKITKSASHPAPRVPHSTPIAAMGGGYSTGEEIANSVLHGIGTLAAAAGLVILALRGRGLLGELWESPLGNAAALVFAGGMTMMFLVSTLYHAIRPRHVKQILRVLDHSAIYLFIAGTYTPFCLCGLKGAWGWTLFFAEWALALAGTTLYALGSKALKKIEVAVYILMGWAIVAGWIPLVRSIPAASVVLLIAGGLAYTLGVIWYRKKTMRGTHAIWHAFVLVGALCHWFSVWLLK
jgi:hemolysin III